MSIFYRLSTQLYFFTVKIASFFNHKATLMINGRIDWEKFLDAKIDANSKYIWIHCASLGEFEQGRPLIEKLKSVYGDKYKILLSFFSPSGYEIRKNYSFADVVCYMPFDTPSNASKFISIVNPVCAVFVKYEIWYYHLKELNKNNIPTFLISGIFRKNQIFFKPYGSSYRKSLGFFSGFFLQDEDSRYILNKHGFKNNLVCGDTRIDRVIAVAGEQYSNSILEDFSINRKTIVFGSTWPADEKLISQLINNSDSEKCFIIVPHEISESHLTFIESKLTVPTLRYSRLKGLNPDLRVIIIDSIGLLSKIYRYADVAYIGGGFGKGIHNILEAAVYNIPIIFGPNYSKFREARELIDLKCAWSIRTSEELSNIINSVLSSEKMISDIDKALKAYISSSFGATDKIFEKLQFREH